MTAPTLPRSTALVDAGREWSAQLTEAEATIRAEKARAADPRDWVSLIGEAYRRGDWQTLGYPSWDDYLRGERLSRKFDAPRKPAAEHDTRSVYFIQAVNGGLIKIGVATDPAARLAEIQRMCPIPLRILAVRPGVGQPGEAALHRRFAAARRHGEWFEPTAELLREVTS
jgi:hypothetical protein